MQVTAMETSCAQGEAGETKRKRQFEESTNHHQQTSEHRSSSSIPKSKHKKRREVSAVVGAVRYRRLSCRDRRNECVEVIFVISFRSWNAINIFDVRLCFSKHSIKPLNFSVEQCYCHLSVAHGFTCASILD